MRRLRASREGGRHGLSVLRRDRFDDAFHLWLPGRSPREPCRATRKRRDAGACRLQLGCVVWRVSASGRQHHGAVWVSDRHDDLRRSDAHVRE